MMIWGWGPGMDNLILPKEVGLRIGIGNESIKHLRLQTHYNNPRRVEGKRDNAGIRLYYTPNLRKYDGGIIQTGDAGVTEINNITRGTGYQEYQYDCPSYCTDTWHPINVISSILHMHQKGSMMWSTIWRNGKAIPFNRVEFYQFDLQQSTPKSIQLLPGDRISVHCVYEKDQNRDIKFGEASNEEMCIHYISYYPKLPKGGNTCAFFYSKNMGHNVTYCNDKIQNSNPSQLDPPGGLDKVFGSKSPNYVCKNPANTDTQSSSESDINRVFEKYIFVILGIAVGFIIISSAAVMYFVRRKKLIKTKKDDPFN